MKNCIFCQLTIDRVVHENEHAVAFYDLFPVTEKHALVAPKNHVKDYFDLNESELIACNELLKKLKMEISDNDPSVTGFNIGMNCGEDAGQTIFHCHIHLIPRRKGDVENPRGGVRHLIPGKGDYKA